MLTDGKITMPAGCGGAVQAARVCEPTPSRLLLASPAHTVRARTYPDAAIATAMGSTRLRCHACLALPQMCEDSSIDEQAIIKLTDYMCNQMKGNWVRPSCPLTSS